jgi:hypothetical protein
MDPGWNVRATLELNLANPFDAALLGTLGFTVYPGTDWSIRPESQTFAIEPGERRVFRFQVEGAAPELGPLPRYRAVLASGGMMVAESDEPLRAAIPKPRTGEVVTISVRCAERVPYAFDGSPLDIAADIGSIDTCGRLIVYREPPGEVPECLYVSPLIDFRTGINRFTWNGRDLDGAMVAPGDVSFYLFAYSKDAPVTWTGLGPPDPGGTLAVVASPGGIHLETHTDSALVAYALDRSMNGPREETVLEFGGLLDGLPLAGYARDGRGRLFAVTPGGVAAFQVRNGELSPDPSFGTGGYVRFTDRRGKLPGAPSWHDGRLYIGFGGDAGVCPEILVLDSERGRTLDTVPLDMFPPVSAPPAVTAGNYGIRCAHPESGVVVQLAFDGSTVWVNGRGDTRIGAEDSDGLSYTHHIGTDRFGFSYVNTPGTSVRCGVLGPVGRGLFRVILVQLPGLRTAAAIPLIEGWDTDGLFFVTRGGDHPYVFHVPFTIRKGSIVPEASPEEDNE